jgi:serine/threonine protein kinase
MSTVWTRALEGRTLAGRYVLERLVGEGGMGAVFAGVQLAVQRRVAVKVLLPGVANDSGVVERFRREAELAANVARRGVPQIIDFDRDPVAGPFVVMELLAGESLAHRLNRHGRLHPLEAVGIATSILETLEPVHARGVIHRDLKPANVFLAREGAGAPTVKVLDFGVARVLAPHGNRTAHGAVIGTPRYMAPEQAAGAKVDVRADVYAVGAILYACLGGKPYAHAVGEDVLEAVHAGPPPPLSQVNPELPADLVAIVDRAMARTPDARFASVAADGSRATSSRGAAAQHPAATLDPRHDRGLEGRIAPGSAESFATTGGPVDGPIAVPVLARRGSGTRAVDRRGGDTNDSIFGHHQRGGADARPPRYALRRCGHRGALQALAD